MGYSITCPCTFLHVTQEKGREHPWCKWLRDRSFSSLPSGHLCPDVPSSRQDIRPSSFNASETFTAFMLIRDVLTFCSGGSSQLKLLLSFHWGV